MIIREIGTVKWFNGIKRYGFIVRDKGTDIFFHKNDVRDKDRYTLKEGQLVEFIVGEGRKGPQARDVGILDSCTGSDREVGLRFGF